MSGVVSLTLGNSSFPFWHCLVRDSKFFCQLVLRQPHCFSARWNKGANFTLIHHEILLSVFYSVLNFVPDRYKKYIRIALKRHLPVVEFRFLAGFAEKSYGKFYLSCVSFCIRAFKTVLDDHIDKNICTDYDYSCLLYTSDAADD